MGIVAYRAPIDLAANWAFIPMTNPAPNVTKVTSSLVESVEGRKAAPIETAMKK
jgi:hypothetical protein